MKNILLPFVFLLFVFFFFACEKELATYAEKSTIYFNEAGRLPAHQGEALTDSMVVSFSLSAASDSIVHMVINSIGRVADFDRPYKLAVNAQSDMLAGKHYVVLNPNYIIKKNQAADTLKIRFLRTVEMQKKNFLLSFDLLENEHFSTAMQDKVINKKIGKRLSYINYRWFVNDILKRPSRWYDDALGNFSRKKLFLMVDLLGIDPVYLDKTASIAELYAYGKFMQRYLNEQRVGGNILYEEDGVTVMVMGAGVQ